MDIEKDYDFIEKVKRKTLANKGYRLDKVIVYPPTLDKIFEVDEERYNFFLNLITFDLTSIEEHNGVVLTDEEKEEILGITLFDALVENINQDRTGELESDIIEMLEFFLCLGDEKIHYINTNLQSFFYIDDISKGMIIDNRNFNKIVDIVKIQNDILNLKKKKQYNPASEKANKLIQKLKEREEKLAKIKKRTEVNLHDLVSILASNGNNLNLLNIWDLNIYQFNDQLARLQINENYELQKFLLGNAYAGDSIDFEKNNYFKKISVVANKEENKTE